MYPDPSIPAIVSEELWDRANALYKQRSAQMMVHQSAAGFHNRYPYSGKIFCEEHGASFHRQVLKLSLIHILWPALSKSTEKRFIISGCGQRGTIPCA